MPRIGVKHEASSVRLFDVGEGALIPWLKAAVSVKLARLQPMMEVRDG
jgi:hypothetical protein